MHNSQTTGCTSCCTIPGIDQFLTAPTPPQRADGTVDIALPNHFQEGQGHVWLFTADRKGRNVSRSVYLGEVALA